MTDQSYDGPVRADVCLNLACKGLFLRKPTDPAPTVCPRCGKPSLLKRLPPRDEWDR